MALINCNLYSRYLGYNTQISVIIPQQLYEKGTEMMPLNQCKVLYLFHGRGDDCTGWVRCTRIEQLAMENNFIVITPSVEDSFYENGEDGRQFYSYVSEELPQIMENWFGLSRDPENTYIGGLSMGGYGALKLGLTHPEKYAGIIIMSAGIDPNGLFDFFDNDFDNETLRRNLTRVFGSFPVAEKYQLINILKADIDEGLKVPFIIQFEGKQDELLEMNRTFHEQAENLGQQIYYEEWDGGHDWIFWDQAIKKAFGMISGQ